MKYELGENLGIPAPLLALMTVATGLWVTNCCDKERLWGRMVNG